MFDWHDRNRLAETNPPRYLCERIAGYEMRV
jgi:hypothetical protein